MNTMKRHFIRSAALGIMAIIFVAGCGKKKDQQILDLQTEKTRLEKDYERKDSLLNELFLSVNAIEKNLADITIREKLITDTPDNELRSDMDVRDKIMEEIILINNIIEENKKRIASLRDQLKKSDTRVAALEENIRILTQRLEEKEKEIASLKEELVRLNFTIESLNATVDTLLEEGAEKSKVISQQDLVIGEMNTVWYVIGTRKELTDKEIIDKAGGMFSGEMKLNNMINPDYFTTGDIREMTSISFDAKKAELATVHPAGSYEFIVEEDQYKGIKILSPTEFWKSSRFLVVVVK